MRKGDTAVAQKGRVTGVQPHYAPVTDAVPCQQNRVEIPVRALYSYVRGRGGSRARSLRRERWAAGAARMDDLGVAT